MLRSLLVVLFALATFTHAQTQRWTLQTSAFRGAEQAQAAVRDLRSSGFDAYSERSGDVTRVRVGCFLDRASAEDVAASVAQRSDVQVVALSANISSDLTFCVRREAGFALPAAWGVAGSTPAHITFWVDAAGQRYLRFDGRDWRVYQDATPLQGIAAGEVRRERLSQAGPIRVDSLLIGSGRLLWSSPAQSTRTVVVQGETEIFTLTLLSPSEVE